MFGLCAPRLRPSRSAHVASQCGRNTEIAVRFDKTPTEPVGAETGRKMEGGSIPTNLLQAAMQLMEGDTTEIADVSAHLRRLRFGTSVVPVRALTVSLLLSGRIKLRRRDRVEVMWYAGELLFSIEESEVAQVIGSVEALCFTFRLDALFLSDLLQSDDIPDFSSSPTVETPFIVLADDEWLMSLTRLLRLAARSGLRKERLSLIVQELHCLALLTLKGRGLADFYASGTPLRKIARALAWLSEHYREPFYVDRLADYVLMAPSTFDRQFHRYVASTPVQYLKDLRLREARRLMLDEGLDAHSAAFAVGYVSAQQFSRAYKCLSGDPPRKSIRKLRSGLKGE